MSVTSLLLAKVLERQRAAAMSAGYLIDPEGTYTLAQLKTEVNRMAPSYLDGAYTGGAALPTRLGATYADAATTELELLALVLALTTTVSGVGTAGHVVSRVNGDFRLGQSYDGTSNWIYPPLGLADAIVSAKARYAYSTPTGSLGSAAATCVVSDPAYWAECYTQNALLRVDQLWTGVGKTVRFFAKGTLPTGAAKYVYSTHGNSVPDEGEYGEVDEQTLAAAADAVNSAALVAEDPDGMTFPGGAGTNGTGFWLTDEFVLVEWDFSGYVPAGAPDPMLTETYIERRDGLDYTWQCVSEDPELWVEITPDAAEFPSGPENGATWVDSHGFEWMYCEPAAAWYAEYAGRRQNPGWQLYAQRVTVPAGATEVLVEFEDPIDTGVDLVPVATPTWQTSFWIEDLTSRWCTLRFGTAPVYAATCYLAFLREQKVIVG